MSNWIWWRRRTHNVSSVLQRFLSTNSHSHIYFQSIKLELSIFSLSLSSKWTQQCSLSTNELSPLFKITVVVGVTGSKTSYCDKVTFMSLPLFDYQTGTCLWNLLFLTCRPTASMSQGNLITVQSIQSFYRVNLFARISTRDGKFHLSLGGV